MVKKLPVLGMCIPTDELERAKTENFELKNNKQERKK